MFKKTTTAALAALLCAGVSHAETFKVGDKIDFEVNVDVGAYYASVKDSAGESVTQIAGKGMNQVEIKATHKMPGGVKVFGEIEMDFDPVKDNDGVTTDDVKLGLSGDFGKLTVGQFDSFAEDNVFEVLGVGHGEYAYVSEPASGNDARHIQYAHKIGAVSFGADLTHKNNDASGGDKTKSKTGLALGATYKLDALTLGFGYDKITGYDTKGAAASDKSTTGLSAKYKLGDATLLGFYGQTKPVAAGDDKTKYTGFGVTYDMGAVNLGMAYQQVKVGSTKTNETSIGVSYEVYKNMTVYADMLKTGADMGEGDALEIGLAYSF
jgi:predicted porin